MTAREYKYHKRNRLRMKIHYPKIMTYPTPVHIPTERYNFNNVQYGFDCYTYKNDNTTWDRTKEHWAILLPLNS